jgi:hypothetical protein
MAALEHSASRGTGNLPDGRASSTTGDAVLERIHEATSYVETLVASWNGPTTVVERRRWHRVPYDRLIQITPLDDSTNEPTGPPQLVTGRDISLGGVSFMHREPLACRKVACAFNPNSRSPESVVVRLTWCRFTKDGFYQSGGQFVQAVSRNGRGEG